MYVVVDPYELLVGSCTPILIVAVVVSGRDAAQAAHTFVLFPALCLAIKLTFPWFLVPLQCRTQQSCRKTITMTARSDDDERSHQCDDKAVKSVTTPGQQCYSLSDWLVLPTIVFSQFAGTSLWFAPNSVVSQVESFGESQVVVLVSCVQVGFIMGTLVLTFFALTDRWSPPLLFTGSCLLGAALNVMCVATTNFPAWAILRLLVGVCLAGVYPVGMKIAATEYPSGLGARLGVLVGALTLGTAFPWLVRGISDKAGLPFEVTLGAVSAMAALGAMLMAVVMIPRGDGFGSAAVRHALACCFNTNFIDAKSVSIAIQKEDDKTCAVEESPRGNTDVCTDISLPSHHCDSSGIVLDQEEGVCLAETETSGRCDGSKSVPDHQLAPSLSGMAALRAMVGSSGFRAAAIGYFGHMWELYAFWAHMPSLVNSHSERHGGVVLGNEAMTSFAVIGVGAISCFVGGILSLRAGRGVVPGSAVVASVSLIVSGCCCLLVPFYQRMGEGLFLFFLLVWGSAVVADSAQFSSLAAMYAYPGLVGTSLTLTTSIGFAITIVSIQLLGALIDSGWDPGNALALLAIGPAIGAYRSYAEWPLHRICFTSKSENPNETTFTDDINNPEGYTS